MNARDQLLDELIAERYRVVPPPPETTHAPQEPVSDRMLAELNTAYAQRDQALADIETLRERVHTLEQRATEHRCRPHLRSAS